MNKFKFLAVAVFVVTNAVALTVSAEIVDVTGKMAVTGSDGSLVLEEKNTEPFKVLFSDASQVEQVLYSDNTKVDIREQSPNNIKEIVKAAFNLTEVTPVNQGGGGKVKMEPFQYLALHIGDKRELLFKFRGKVEGFTIKMNTKGGGGLGDWRVFNGIHDTPAVL